MVDSTVSSPEWPETRRSWRRWLCGLALICLVGLLPLIRCCAIMGWLRPIRIAGGSMAGELYGPHYLVRCQDCRITFRCGTEYVPREKRCVCPNCGYADNPVPSTSYRPGRRVTIDRWPQWRDGPQLWQSVAFVQTQRHDQVAVKRIVACGAGQLEIRDGDVYLDGQVQRKSLDQLRRLRVPVHDDRYRPNKSGRLPDRWSGAKADSRWQTMPGGYRCVAHRDGQLDWLAYSQWTCWLNPSPPAPRTTDIAIFDNYAYNQNLARGALRRVYDLMLVTQFRVRGQGVAALLIDDLRDQFQLRIAYPAANCSLIQDGAPVWRRQLEASDLWSVELALCDHQVLVEVNGVEMPPLRYQPAATPRTGRQRLAVGAARLEMTVLRLQVFRDIHYTGPSGENRWIAPDPLVSRQCFVIGDNAPASVDSRRIGPIREQAIIGPVAPLGD